MPTLSISGSVLRAETVLCSTLANLVITEAVTTDEIDTITIPFGESFTPSFSQSDPAKFVVIASTISINVFLNGMEPLQLTNLIMSGSAITDMVLSNPSSDTAAVVRVILGK